MKQPSEDALILCSWASSDPKAVQNELLGCKYILKHFCHHQLLERKITKNPSLLYESQMTEKSLRGPAIKWCRMRYFSNRSWKRWNRGEERREENLPTPDWALSKTWDTGFVALKELLKEKTIELGVEKNRDLGSIGKVLIVVAAVSSCALIKDPVFHCKAWWKHFHREQTYLSIYKPAAVASNSPTAQRFRNNCLISLSVLALQPFYT